MQINDWLKKNSFHYSDFQDIEHLLKLKKEQGVSISLGLPTKNVEQSLEPILFTVKNYLQEQYPLIDEIAIIDAGSTDKTAEIAKNYDIDVYTEAEIMPEVGRQRGKGEALWKSLAVLKGDIVAWIDTDIKNIDPRFVYGIIGPLLTRQDIHFVKAHYRRPIKEGDVLMQSGGGRVTELVVRPFLNLFYPELSALAQPLSGEYAGRRSLLEQIPFYTGYAVETAMIIEIWRRLGLSGMAQVDLEERIHENQSILALGAMSFEIMQAIFELLQEDKKITLETNINTLFNQVACDENNCKIESRNTKIVRRVPIKEIPFYGT